MLNKFIPTAAIVLLCLSSIAQAQTESVHQNAKALPTDSRMVVLKYNASQIYNILAAQDYITHIELQKDEQLSLNPAMGDSIQWQVESESNHIFIRPDVANIRTNMTLVTNKRTYHFMLLSSPEGGVYYQHVQFKYPESSLRISKTQNVEPDSSSPNGTTNVQNQNINLGDPTKNNFDYEISGQGDFKPQSVQDNGKFIYIKFNDALKELPVVFVREGKSGFNQVNFSRTVTGNFITITQLADEIILVLDNEKITIKKKKKGFWD